MGTETDGKDLGYFMGRVDNQLTQILERLEDMRCSLNALSQEQSTYGKQLASFEDRLTCLEDWKKTLPDTSDFIRWSTLREKITVPVIVSIVIFLLTTVGPAVLFLVNANK